MSETTRAPPATGSLVVYVYPTISPQVVVIPIVSCIIVFPILVLIIICALRYRAMRARRFDKRSRGRLELNAAEHASGSSGNNVRCNDGRPVMQCKNGKRKTIVRFKPMPELDLDTVVEERSDFDAEVNALELLQPPKDPNRLCVINHPISFRSFRFGYGASGQPLAKSSDLSSKPLGSPVPKRAKTLDDCLNLSNSPNCSSSSTHEKTSSFSTLSPKIDSSLSSSAASCRPFLATDLDEVEKGSDSLMQKHPLRTVDTSEETEEPEKVAFIIPSVSIEPCVENDCSDDSISFIDKSEEVTFISECKDSSMNITKVKFEIKISNDNQNSDIQITDSGVTKNSIELKNNISILSPDIPSVHKQTLGFRSQDKESISVKVPSIAMNRIPERHHRPTQLDFTLDNRETNIPVISSRKVKCSVVFSDIPNEANNVTENTGSCQLQTDNGVMVTNGNSIVDDSEFSDSDEV